MKNVFRYVSKCTTQLNEFDIIQLLMNSRRLLRVPKNTDYVVYIAEACSKTLGHVKGV